MRGRGTVGALRARLGVWLFPGSPAEHRANSRLADRLLFAAMLCLLGGLTLLLVLGDRLGSVLFALGAICAGCCLGLRALGARAWMGSLSRHSLVSAAVSVALLVIALVLLGLDIAASGARVLVVAAGLVQLIAVLGVLFALAWKDDRAR